LREVRRLSLLEKRVFKRIFCPKRDEVTGEWRKLHNEKLNRLYCSSNTVRVIKWRMRCAGYVACVWRREAFTGLWRGNVRERDHLEDQGVDGRIILRQIFMKWDVDWIELARDRDRGRAILIAEMNLQVP